MPILVRSTPSPIPALRIDPLCTTSLPATHSERNRRAKKHLRRVIIVARSRLGVRSSKAMQPLRAVRILCARLAARLGSVLLLELRCNLSAVRALYRNAWRPPCGKGTISYLARLSAVLTLTFSAARAWRINALMGKGF